MEHSSCKVAELVGVGSDHCSMVATKHGRVGSQVPEAIGVEDNRQLESLDPFQDESQPPSHALVATKTRTKHDTVEPGKPVLDLLEAVLLVKNRVDHQLGTVTSHHSTGLLLTEDVHNVGATAKR